MTVLTAEQANARHEVFKAGRKIGEFTPAKAGYWANQFVTVDTIGQYELATTRGELTVRQKAA